MKHKTALTQKWWLVGNRAVTVFRRTDVGSKLTLDRKQTKMDKTKCVRLTFFLTLVISFVSCNQETKSNGQREKFTECDAIIVKHKRELNNSYEVGFYSKAFSYYWLVGKDTLDFVVNATEHEKDSTLHLSIHHKKPILFTTALTKIKECLSLINEDFYLSKLTSFYFKDPIYYLDLAKKLSAEYEQQFGRKNINFEKQNQFLLGSKLNLQLNELVSTYNKETRRLGIEKFHLLDKKYFGEYLSEVNLTEYPEFTIHGMGLSVYLVNKNNE